MTCQQEILKAAPLNLVETTSFLGWIFWKCVLSPLRGASSGLEFVCLCLVRGPDVRGDLGEKEQSSDVKGTSFSAQTN